MGNETKGKRFEATGPNEGFGVFGISGFYTNANRLGYGVNAQVTRTGVYGECLRSGQETDRESETEGNGVCGIGDGFGIFGDGSPGLAGVIGIHKHGKVGVIGAEFSHQGEGPGTGIVGISLSSLGNPLSTFESILDPAHATDQELISLGDGKGVFGSSGEGTGVYGSSNKGKGGEFKSNTGIGVTGFSKGNRGGAFKSGEKFAQMRLVPSDQRDNPRPPELPKKGQVGDLMLIRSIVRIKEEDIDMCSLWLCIPQDPGSNNSDQWQEIDLGRRVTGTLE